VIIGVTSFHTDACFRVILSEASLRAQSKDLAWSSARQAQNNCGSSERHAGLSD
jgi:hypothetical protein